MNQILALSHVRKSYGGKVVLDDVTLSFLPGAKIGVVGPNWTGKSTLLRMMADLEQPSNGEVRLMPGYTVGIPAQEPALDEARPSLTTWPRVPRPPGLPKLLSPANQAGSAWRRTRHPPGGRLAPGMFVLAADSRRAAVA